MEKKRLDLFLMEVGLASTRTKSQELIASGKVSVDGEVVRKAGEKVGAENQISVSETEHPYVSRGGVKLDAALAHFGIDLQGLRILDIGQSTGGFTHCALLRGASEVVGVDVGTGQLSPLLREDARVRSLEKQDIRALSPQQAGPPFPFFVVDLSFISLSLVLPALPRFLCPGAEGIVLVKPQFEVGPDRIGSGGIVRDAAAREWALGRVRLACAENGFTVTGEMPSPISGGNGNREFLLRVVRLSSEAGI